MNHGHGDISPLDVFVRAEFLYDGESHHGEYVEAYIFGATSIKNRALTFTAMLADGCQFTRLPLHAFTYLQHDPHLDLDWLQLWDCFDYSFSYHQYSYLKDWRCRVFLKDGSIAHAQIIPPTSQNQLIIEEDLRELVTQLADWDDEKLCLRCEHLIRNYDPCISCSVHFLKFKREESKTNAEGVSG